METDVNGCSTCAKGCEDYRFFRRGKSGPWLCQYDYRDTSGELFSCIGKGADRQKESALQNARDKRDRHLLKKGILE